MSAPVNSLLVERPGSLTTIQDSGRWGLQHLGVPVSGWMDDCAARLAHALAGNDAGAALLEITWRGPTLRAEQAMLVAATILTAIALAWPWIEKPLVGMLGG